MFRTISRLALALALSTVGALALSSPAQANVRTTVYGSSCQFAGWIPRGGTYPAEPGPGNLVGFYFNDGPAITGENFTSVNQQFNTYFPLACPITRQLPLSTAGMSDLEVRFMASTWYANPPVRRVYCDAFATRSDGTVITYKQREVILNEAANAPATVLDFGDDLDKSSSKGSYHLTCWIPYGVALHSIYHSEVDGIDGN